MSAIKSVYSKFQEDAKWEGKESNRFQKKNVSPTLRKLTPRW